MDVHVSARKHGIADEDIDHATMYALAIEHQDDETHGTTASGAPITDAMIDKLAEQAESGYDVDAMLLRRRGRPPIGSAAASVESVRLDPELRQALADRAERDHETTSSIIREALRRYLDVA